MNNEAECFKCGALMLNVMQEPGLQPIGGTCFVSFGHYGSGVFDPMDGSYIQIALCDECLAANMPLPTPPSGQPRTGG